MPGAMFRGQVAVMNYNEVLELFFQVYMILGGRGEEGEGCRGAMFRGQVAVMNYNEVLELFFQVYTCIVLSAY